MKVKDFRELFKDLPDDASVELGKFIALSHTKEAYTVRLDFPIIGVAQRDDEEICLVVGGVHTPKEFIWLQKFGKVEPLE